MPSSTARRSRRPSRKATAPGLGSSKYYFDAAAAGRAVHFFEHYLRHTKGEWAGQPFKLSEWEKRDIIEPLFGWKRTEDGTRRYRMCYVEIPRKNGKSTLAAAIALYLLVADGEPGAEVYSCAGDREQAHVVFDQAAAMRDMSPAITKRTVRYKRAISHPAMGGTYRVLSSDAFTKHGLNPHGVIFDELHVQPNRELWDAMTTAQGARRQPIVFAITTAGYDRHSLCWSLHEHALRVLKGEIQDDEFLPVIYTIGPKDDWKNPRVWAKANPNLGVTVSMSFLKAAAKRAKEIPAFENTFKQLHLNVWTEQSTRWLPMHVWDSSSGSVDVGALEGLPCWGGLDLASTTDIAALVLDFVVGDVHKWLPFFWVPSEKIRERAKRDRVPYDVWARQGLIKATEGNVIDYRVIVADLLKLRQVFDIREVAFDRWGAAKITTDLIEEGFTMVPFGQGFASMSAPTKELMTLLLAKKLHHGSDPVLRWMAGNVVTRKDPAGNLKPDKEKSPLKIDGIVAGIMSLDRAIRGNAGKMGKSVYDSRDIREVG